EATKELKVLLFHKTQQQNLQRSIPVSNKAYFSMTDIAIPRINIQTSIDTYHQLNDAFKNVLSVKESLKQKFSDAYQTCKIFLEDEFDGGDPTADWSSLLDQHFAISNSIYVQYLYDYIRDLSKAYNELLESLFSSHEMCCPEVNLFPKHVLLGQIKAASVQSRPFPSSPVSDRITIPAILEEPSFRRRLFD